MATTDGRDDVYSAFKLQYGEEFVEFLVLAMNSSRLRYFPKLEQVDALFNLLKGRDVLVNLPTGFGKSWIYSILPFICDHLRKKKNSKVIVVSPLISLMEDQIAKLRSIGIEVVKATDILGERDTSHFKIIMLSPEAFEVDKVKELLKDMREDIVSVAVDEAHCIEQWGRSFRSAYDNLRELRSLLLPGLPFVALTATASQSTSNYIISKLDMEGCHIVKVSVNKENIFYQVKALPKFNSSDLNSQHIMLVNVFSSVVQNVKTFKEKAQKTIIFCFTTKDCADVFEYFKSELGDGIALRGGLLVNMYMKVTDAISKSKIVEEFTKEDGILRVVIATSAFGMGVDCPNVSQVIHFKSPGTLMEYVQGSGRAGRDGSAATSILYYSLREFATRKAKMTKSKASKREFAELQAMRSYCENTEKCRRQLLITHFDGKSQAASQCKMLDRHKCCDICVMSCKCEVCVTERDLVACCMAAETHSSIQSTEDQVKIRELTHNQKDELKGKLLEYRQSMTSQGGSLFNVNITTGLTRQVIEQVVDNSEYVTTVDDIMQVANVWDREQAAQILHIIEHFQNNH